MPSRALVAAAVALSVGVAFAAPLLPQEPPTDLVQLAARLDGARVGPRIGPLPSLRIGRAEIRPLQPDDVRALVADGRVCGLLFGGRSTLRYTIEDRFSLPLARHNLKGSGLTLVGTEVPGTIEEPLEAAAVWGFDLVPAPSAAVAGSATEELPAWLARALASRLDSNPGRDLALSLANGEPGYRWALLHRSGDDLLLDVDPRPSARLESLAWMRRLTKADAGALAGTWIHEPIVVQPIGRAWWEATPFSLAAVDTEIALGNPKGEQVRVTTRTRLQAQVGGLRLLPLWLQSGIWDSDGAYQDYRVVSVSLDGQPAPYTHRQDDLVVAPSRPLDKGQIVTLEVVTEGEILDRPDGDNFWWLGLEAWYPRPAAGGFEWSEIRVSAESSRPYVPFASGEVVRRESTPAGARVEVRLTKPMDRATVLAGRYSTVTEELNGSRVHVSTYAAVREEEARRLGRLVFAVRGCLERWLGVPYPFQDLQVIEISDWGWGQAPAGMIYITKEAFLTRSRAQADEDDQEIADAVSRGINERVAHEVAHGWFPHVAKVMRREEEWLSESLAEYASAVCLQSVTADTRQGRQIFERQLRDWRNMDREVKEGASLFLAGYLPRLGAQAGSREFLLYGRGPLVLHAVRQELRRQKGEEEGDRLFLTWIRSYAKTFTYRIAETRHLISILDQITGQSWQAFFERHVYGPEPPKPK